MRVQRKDIHVIKGFVLSLGVLELLQIENLEISMSHTYAPMNILGQTEVIWPDVEYTYDIRHKRK
jgi:hypothetical protein